MHLQFSDSLFRSYFPQLKRLIDHSNYHTPCVRIIFALFEKIGKKVFLPPTGKELESFCLDLFTRIDEMDMKLSAMKGQLEGEFHLAAVTSAKYFTPHLLGAFHKRHPKVRLNLDVVNRSHIIQCLKNNEDGLVIMGLVPEDFPLTHPPYY